MDSVEKFVSIYRLTEHRDWETERGLKQGAAVADNALVCHKESIHPTSDR